MLMRNKMIWFVSFLFTLMVLVFPGTSAMAAGSGIEDVITRNDTITLLPNNNAYKKASLFEVSDKAAYGYFNTKPCEYGNIWISGYTYTVLSSADFSGINCLEVDMDSHEIKFTGTEADAKKIVGLEYELTVTVESSRGDMAELAYRLLLVEDKIAIDESGDFALMPGKSTTARLFTGSAEVLGVEWSSSDTSVVKVSANSKDNGLTAVVKAVKQGSATVTATVKTKDSTVPVTAEYTVNWVPGRMVLSFDKVTLYKNESVELTVSNVPEDATVTFKSSKKSVASVSKTTGRIKALKKGKATITVTVKAPATEYSPAETYTLKCVVTVKNAGKVTSVSTLGDLKKYLTNGKGGKLKLTSDIKGPDYCIKIKSGTYRIDLNGYTIRGTGDGDKNGMIVVDGGKLTVLDSKGGGQLINEYSQEAVGCSKGTLNIYGGGIWGLNYAVYGEGGTTNLYGGEYYAYGTAVKQHGGKLNIYGGLYACIGSSRSEPGLSGFSGLCGSGSSVIKVKGGTFAGENGIVVTSAKGSITLDNCTVNSYMNALALYSGDITVNGGKYDAVDSNAVFACPVSGTVNLEVNGGIFSVNNDINVVYAQNESYISVNGGWFINNYDRGFIWEANSLIMLTSTFKGKWSIKNGLVPADEIQDLTPEGQNIPRTDFVRTKDKYKAGMTVKTANQMYSVYMDAYENLCDCIEFKCDSALEEILDYYCESWRPSRSYSTCNWEVKPAGDGLLSCTFNIAYTPYYELERICVNPELVTKASAETKKCAGLIDEIVEECTAGKKSKLEIAKAFHDYMCKNYTYDYSFNSESYYPAGLLLNKTGVCQAYALLYKGLCLRAGIECEMVEGVAGEPGKVPELHGWNVVYIDGKELYVDVTFDDGTGSDKWCLKDEDTFYGYGYHR